MTVFYKGAITFEDEAALKRALESAEATLSETSDSLISMDEIATLGLHLTISHNTSGSAAQINAANSVIETLVSEAYSGYIDVTTDSDETRFHAKEIDPTPVEQIEKKMGVGTVEQ